MNYIANDILRIIKLAKNYNAFLIRQVVKIIRKNNYKNILDFGCADGYFLETMKKNCQEIVPFGVEIDNSSIEFCRQKNLNIYENIKDIPCNLDLIYSFNVLEHIETDTETMQNFYDILEQNGKLVLYVPALTFLFSSMDKKVGHYRRYEKQKLIDKLTKIGFIIEKIEFCDSLGVLATLLYILKDTLLKNNNGNISKISIVLYDIIFPLSRLLDILVFKKYCGKNLLVIAKK